jgi:hypothetical protein
MARPGAGGTLVHCIDGTPTASYVDYVHGLAGVPSAAWQQYQTTEFFLAAMLSDQHPELAMAQLAWVKQWCAASPATTAAFFRASSLLGLLVGRAQAGRGGSAFVPFLSSSVYGDDATAYAAQAGAYESTLRSLQIEQTVDANFIKLAQTLLLTKVDEAGYAETLVSQAESNYTSARAAVAAAQADFKTAQTELTRVQINFTDVGIPAYREKETLEAVVDFTLAFVQLAVAVAGLAAAGGAGGAAGGAAAGSAAKATTATVAAAAAAGEAADQVGKLKDALESLATMIQSLQAMYAFTERVAQAAANYDDAGGLVAQIQDTSIPLVSGPAATAQWQIYQATAESVMQAPIDAGIEYASDVKLAIDTVSLRGQALVAAQVAAVQAGQDFAAASLRSHLAHIEQAQMETYVSGLLEGEKPLAVLVQGFYQRYVDAKSALFAALAGYRASYAYWALRPSSVDPSIADDVGTLGAGVAQISSVKMDTATALAAFSQSPPQTLHSKTIVIDSEEALESLRTQGQVQLFVTDGDPTFANYDRVRLTRVRVWLEGALPAGRNKSVTIVITTTGTYRDRLNGASFQFAAQPMSREFSYRVGGGAGDTPDWTFDTGEHGYVEIDGEVDHEVSFAYFEPTPFTSWTFSIVDPGGLDLTKVSMLTVDLAGSVIPHQGKGSAT